MFGKKDKHKFTGFVGDCSPEQEEALKLFREFVITLNQGVLDPRWDEYFLLRFLRARKFIRKDTEKMWSEFIAWRKRENVDELQRFFFPELSALRKLYPHGYHKFDKQFRPIYIERIGFLHPENIFKLTSEARLLQYNAMSYERLLSDIFTACSEQRLRETGDPTKVLQTCTILDLKDVKLSNASAAYKFVKPASEMAQNNYPQILGKYDSLTQYVHNKCSISVHGNLGNNKDVDRRENEIEDKDSGFVIQKRAPPIRKELAIQINPENLPSFIDGGTCKCPGGDCLSINIGPWNPEGKEFFQNCFVQTQSKKADIEEQERAYLEEQQSKQALKQKQTFKTTNIEVQNHQKPSQLPLKLEEQKKEEQLAKEVVDHGKQENKQLQVKKESELEMKKEELEFQVKKEPELELKKEEELELKMEKLELKQQVNEKGI